MTQDPIKEAFNRAKQDIQSLKDHLSKLTEEIREIKRTIEFNLSNTNQQTDKPTQNPTQNSYQQTNQHINMSDNLIDSNKPTDKIPLYSLKSQYSINSTGNEGVPTDRQTNQQTDKPTQIPTKNEQINILNEPLSNVSNVLNSLDSIKRELKFSFKKLTKQEMLVYATIYQLEEEKHTVDYQIIANKLNLSESSIRDYTLKIIKKGVPLQKTKENNKKVILSIPQDFKRIASLQTILSIRDQ